MDHGQPRMIYAIVVVFILLALVTAMTRRKPEGTPTWTRNARQLCREGGAGSPLWRRLGAAHRPVE